MLKKVRQKIDKTLLFLYIAWGKENEEVMLYEI